MLENQSLHAKAILRHVLFWLAYVLYKLVHEVWLDKDVLSFHLAQQFITDIPIYAVMVYINLYLVMPAFYYPKQYKRYFLASLLLLLAGGLAQRYFTYLIWIPWDRLHDAERYRTENKDFFIPVRILRNAVESYPVIAVTMQIKLMRNVNRQERRLRAMEHEKHTAEMSLLKAQLNPHFYFNTLNSLYALTLKRSALASDLVLKLAALMQYMLYEATGNQVPLLNEVKHLDNYIRIEQLRFADRLELSFHASGDLEGKRLAPLLLLPFVENAFKHGIENHAGWITISVTVKGSMLFFKVENSYTIPATDRANGLGLANVRRRLALIYPDRHELMIRQTLVTYEVELTLHL